MHNESPQRRLAGLTVVEDGSSLAIQLAGRLLSDLGCRVVKLQPLTPSRLPVSESTLAWLSENKERTRRIEEVTKTSIPLQEPTVLLTERTHTHSSTTGFASIVRVVPENDEGFDDVDSYISSKTGVLWSSKEGFGASPRMTKLAIPSVFSAMAASVAVVASSIRFLRHQQESDVVVTLERATLFGIGALGIAVNGELGAGGGSRDRWGKGLYKCKDGRWVQLCTERPKFIEWLGAATGRLEAWRRSGFLDRTSLAESPTLLEAWRSELGDLFSTRNADEWEWVDPRIPLTVVNIDRDMKQSSLVREDFVGEGATFKPTSPLIHFVPRSNALASEPSLGFTNEQGRRDVVPADPPLPLNGITVSDCGSVLAAPVAGRILADLGANVTKIHLPGTDTSDLRYWVDVNRGKTPEALDLRESPFKLDLERVLEADVLIHNFSFESQEPMGVTSRQFFERNPAGIYSEISAYGQFDEGHERRGYEVNAQASYGLMDIDANGKPTGQPLMVNDYATGLALSLGILAGVFGRYIDRRGTAVYGSLARTASLWRATALGSLSDDGLTLNKFGGGTSYLAASQREWKCYERASTAIRSPGINAQAPSSRQAETRVVRMDKAIREAVARNDDRSVSYLDVHGRRISLSGAPWTSTPRISRSGKIFAAD